MLFWFFLSLFLWLVKFWINSACRKRHIHPIRCRESWNGGKSVSIWSGAGSMTAKTKRHQTTIGISNKWWWPHWTKTTGMLKQQKRRHQQELLGENVCYFLDLSLPLKQWKAQSKNFFWQIFHTDDSMFLFFFGASIFTNKFEKNLFIFSF